MKTKVKIVNELGLHARPLSKWLKIVNKYDAKVQVLKGQGKYNGKSIMELMQMNAVKGDDIIIEVTGKDKEEVLNNLVNLVKCGFND